MTKVALFVRSRGFRLACAVIVLIVIAGLAVLMLCDFGVVRLPGSVFAVYLSGWRDVPFNAAEWLDAGILGGPLGSRDPGRDNRRARMVNDVISRLHPGMTRREVENLLGPSECALDDYLFYYGLTEFESMDQKAFAWLRWRSTAPYLVLKYEQSKGAQRLKTVGIEE